MHAPNLILVVVDGLRPDQLGCYGALDTTAPTIDRLAADGVLFEQAIAAGFHTPTTMSAVMSGCYPSTFGGFGVLADQRPRLPEVLRSLGYRTAAFSPNPLLSAARGYQLGFDYFDECPPRMDLKSANLGGLAIKAYNRLLGRWGTGIECPPYLDAQSVTDRTLHWLEQSTEPFFLWIHYMDAHTPYALDRCAFLLPGGQGQRPYPYGFWRRLRYKTIHADQEAVALTVHLYQNGIRLIDGQIARLVQTLESRGLQDQTLLVVLGDHGEAFWEHDEFGHSNHLYEEIIHIPLVVSPGNRAGTGCRISAQVRQLDVAPTLIELARGTPPAAMQGVSLVPLLQGETPPESLPAFSQTSRAADWLVSLREPPWKLIWRVDQATLESHGVELYHLGDDPGERNDLSGDHQARVAAMQARLKEHIATLDLEAHREPPVEAVDPEVLDRLRALGYVDDT